MSDTLSKMSNSWLIPVGAAVLPNIGGWAGSFAVRNNYDTWYKGLNKPTWTPPAWAFGPIWTALYTGMGIASYMVWKDAGGFKGSAGPALGLYAAQLALNWAWTPIFFAYHSPKWGLVDMALLVLIASICTIAFFRKNIISGVIMLPYLVWLGIATSLNVYALVDIGFLGATVGCCAISFYKINQTAGLLLVPYLAWLGIATSLNYYVYKNNEIEDKKD